MNAQSKSLGCSYAHEGRGSSPDDGSEEGGPGLIVEADDDRRGWQGVRVVVLTLAPEEGNVTTGAAVAQALWKLLYTACWHLKRSRMVQI